MVAVPIVNSSVLLLIFSCEGFRLRRGNSRLPTTSTSNVRLWIESFLARVGPGLVFQLSSDKQFTFNAMGGIDGKWCCNAPVDEAGVVDLRGFKALVAEARQDISQSGLRPEWFLALGDQESLMPLWAWLCEGPLVAETTLLISQVLWGIGQHMEWRFHADFEALRNNTMPHEATAMREAAVGSERDMALFHLRYHTDSLRASASSSVLSVAVDASRVAGRSRLTEAAGVPDGTAFWMKTMVLTRGGVAKGASDRPHQRAIVDPGRTCRHRHTNSNGAVGIVRPRTRLRHTPLFDSARRAYFCNNSRCPPPTKYMYKRGFWGHIITEIRRLITEIPVFHFCNKPLASYRNTPWAYY